MPVKITSVADLVEDGFQLIFTCELAGGQFNDVNRILRLALGEELVLVREPQNQYDPFAVLVYAKDTTLLGHIPAKSSCFQNIIASCLMKDNIECKAIVRQLGDPSEHIRKYITLGVYIRVP